MATTSPTDATPGADITLLLQDAAKMFDQANETNMKVRTSAGGSSPVNIDRLDEIFTLAAGTVKAQAAVAKGAQQLETVNVAQQVDLFRAAAQRQEAEAAAASNVAGRGTAAALEVQEKNILLSRGADLAEVYRKSIEDINLSADRRKNLLDAAASQYEKGKLMNVFTGEATFGEFLNATFIDTPKEFLVKAAVEGEKIQYDTQRLASVTAAFTGSVERNKATAVNLETGSIADARTLAAQKSLQAANQSEISALIVNSQNLQRVVATANHQQNVALGEGKLAVDVENSKRAHARWELEAGAKANPENFAKGVRLGGQYLGSPALANMTADALKIYMNTPATKKLATQAYFVGMGLAGHAATRKVGPLPNLTGSAGDSALLLEDSRGNLPTGMGRAQRMLQNLAANTDYAMVNGVQGAALKPEQRADLIDQKAAAYYQDNVADIDGTETYGKPKLADITELPSMNSDPDVAQFNKLVLAPLAAATDTVPADLIVKAGLSSGLDMNTQIKGLVAFAQSVKALHDANAQYHTVGLKPAQNIPYTAALTSPFNRRKSVALDDEVAVRNFLVRVENESRVLGAQLPEVAKTGKLPSPFPTGQ